MLLAVDIGNTNIHMGLFEAEQLCHTLLLSTEPHRTADEYALLLRLLQGEKGIAPTDVDGIVLGSVVPSVTGWVSAALQKMCDLPVVTVGPGIKTGFPIRVNDPAELGADLVANAAGALAKVGSPVIIVDCGTATTVIVMDEKGALQGGCIRPGIQMSLDALHGTELLPGLSAEDAVTPLGKSTAACMRAGVIRGEAMAVSGFAEQYRQMLSLPRETTLVVTGGLAAHLLPYLPKSAVHIPDLTLHGLAAIYRLNQK